MQTCYMLTAGKHKWAFTLSANNEAERPPQTGLYPWVCEGRTYEGERTEAHSHTSAHIEKELQLLFLRSTFENASHTSLGVNCVHVWRVWSVWLPWQRHSGFLPGDIRELLSVSSYLPTSPAPPPTWLSTIKTPEPQNVHESGEITKGSTETEGSTRLQTLALACCCEHVSGCIQEVWLFPSDLPPSIFKHSFCLKHKSQFLSSRPFGSRFGKFSRQHHMLS